MIEGLDGLYELKKTVGSGGFAKVKLATHVLTGEKVAIKMMKKATLGDDIHRVKLELEALKVLSHRHICKLYQVIETKTHYFLIIEYCSGGELFDHIVEKNRLSENESRIYFRQIVSAVAHLHSLGFVHRDLKPENILLDRDQNLKLIDFGLCAKPSGGMETYLYTSCGSPSYAAPELVLGQKYLGAEVDIWSLGVLLYALLCGYLPFDDNELPTLYSKILSGKYPEAEWLSNSSKQLIYSMLQVDPKKRITIEELQVHPWLMAGGRGPIVNRNTQGTERDEECVAVLARHNGLSSRQMWARISSWKYDYDTATYLLLLQRKRRGLSVRLVGNRHPLRSKLNRGMLNLNDLNENDLNERIENNPLKSVDPETYLVLTGKESTPDCNHTTEITTDKENEKTPVVPTRKPHKRHHSPEPSPVPFKMTPRTARTLDRQAPVATPSTPTRKPTAFLSPMESPSRSARRMLGSIERGLNRVRHVLTPRRRGKQEGGGEGPAVLSSRGLCNVSTTSSSDADQVLSKLHDALISKGIAVKQKGFTLRGKLEYQVCKLSFELEVCIVSQGSSTASDVPTLVGIRRKRLKGDVWCYKRICEEVLAMAAVEEPRTHTS